MNACRVPTLLLLSSLLLAGCGGGGGSNTAPVRFGEGGVDSGIQFDHLSADIRPLSNKPAGGAPSPLCVRGDEPQLGLTELSRQDVGERSIEITFVSEAMSREEKILITLPVDYDASGNTRYPLLYLLHGSVEDHLSWYNNGAEPVLAAHSIITVSPNGGGQGKYSDFYGTPRSDEDAEPLFWEAFHIRELLPWLEANYPIATRPGLRAIAGLSAGGYGATKYSSVFPGLFGSAASFSGGLNTTYQYPLLPAVYSSAQPFALATGDDPESCTWGDPYVHKVLWIGNDPTHIAENMLGTRIWLSGGDGTPGELDTIPRYDPVERQTYDQTLEYIAALDDIGLPHTDDLYGAGTHTWPYWIRALERFLSWQAPFWGQPINRPPSFNHRSVYHQFQAWGWQFAVQREVDEFVYLRDVSASGFEVSGTGVLQVLTAELFAPLSGYRVTINSETGSEALLIRSSETGRLEITVDIAPSSTLQQQDFDQAAIDALPMASVEIEALP